MISRINDEDKIDIILQKEGITDDKEKTAMLIASDNYKIEEKKKNEQEEQKKREEENKKREHEEQEKKEQEEQNKLELRKKQSELEAEIISKKYAQKLKFIKEKNFLQRNTSQSSSDPEESQESSPLLSVNIF